MGNVAFLGVRMPMVAYGEPNYPVMTGGAAGGTFAPGSEVFSETATFIRETVEPKRLSARYLMNMEDMARFPSLEDILRSDLRTVMTQLRDTQILTGPGTGASISGITTELPDIDVTDAQAAAIATFENLYKMLFDGIDGKYAATVRDIRWLFGIASYKFMANVRLTSSAKDETFVEAMDGLRVQYRTSAFIPDAATHSSVTDIQAAIRTSRASDAVAPVWQGITMIRDPCLLYTSPSPRD